MNVLAMDTSTEVLCLGASRADAWAGLVVRRGLQHSPSLLPLAEQLLGSLPMSVGELELVVCSVGPGSFTGIRIGISTALGIAQGRGIPVVGVSSLDALARPWAVYDGDVFPVIDARRGNIYTACYRQGARAGEYSDLSPEELLSVVSRARTPLLVGPDAPAIRDMLGEPGAGVPVSELMDPRCILDLGVHALKTLGPDAAFPRPLYLRPSEAERVQAEGTRRVSRR